MKFNKINTILFAVASFLSVAACQKPQMEDFGVDTDNLQIGADGGVRKIHVNSSGTWVAKVQVPWITVSPANGQGPAECQVLIDSSLTFESDKKDTALIRIQNVETGVRQDIEVLREGYKKTLSLDKTEQKVESFAEYDKRTFVIKVKSNLPFEVKLQDEAKDWLSYDLPELDLDRGARPREIPVTFKWNINFKEGDAGNRETLVSFDPVGDDIFDSADELTVRQEGAEVIEEGVDGDRKAILSIITAMNSSMKVTTSEALENWENVRVWESGPNKGRVRSLRIEMVNTKESLPFQLKYLTACEELVIYSNVNAFLKNLSTGEYLSQMTQLKRLTIGAYGLTELDPSFVALKNLEYLNLEGNNFQDIPAILTPQNFPELHALVMHANQRNVIYDLSNTVKENYGGLADASFVDSAEEPSFPRRLLEWEKLDTLRLSVNFLQGSIPDMEEYPIRWTEEEVMANDTLKTAAAHLVGKPKILPNLNYFAINLNKLSGNLPEWLLYHPKMDLWFPFSLVFEQEGKDRNGTAAGFKNRPANLDEYYKSYPNKKYNPNNKKEE